MSAVSIEIHSFQADSAAAFETAHGYASLYSMSPLWDEYRLAWIERFEREAAGKPRRFCSDCLRMAWRVASEFGGALLIGIGVVTAGALAALVDGAGSVKMSVRVLRALPPDVVHAGLFGAVPLVFAVAIVALLARIAFGADIVLPWTSRRREVMLRWSAVWWQAKAGLVPDPFDPDAC